MFKITIDGQDVNVNAGDTILDSAVRLGLETESLCGGTGSCGKCSVTADGEQVLACLTNVKPDMTVHTRFHKPEIDFNQETRPKLPITDMPLFTYKTVPIPESTVHDSSDDWTRLCRAAGMSLLPPSLSLLQNLPKELRQKQTELSLSIMHSPKGNILGKIYASNIIAVIDMGTTSASAALADLNSGKILGQASGPNLQYAYGGDILTRMIASEKNLQKLTAAGIETINGLLAVLCEQNGLRTEDIDALVISANTVMTHLLYAIPVTSLRKMPFAPVVNTYPIISASELNLTCGGIVTAIPSISGYIGGDIVSGILHCGMHEKENITLLMDIGTNGEIAMGCKDWMLACSCSAGPAFEGGGIKCGMRAAKGAVYEVKIKPGGLLLKTIENAPPRGICGTGLMSLAAELLRTGQMDRRGKLKAGKKFFLTDELFIDEDDMQNLIRAKAAMYAGMEILLESTQIKLCQIKTIYLAGGIGTHLNKQDAVTLGLLPETDNIEMLGNSSLKGALQIAFDANRYRKAYEVSQSVTVIELSNEPSFTDKWTAACFLPHTDGSRFPKTIQQLSQTP